MSFDITTLVIDRNSYDVNCWLTMRNKGYAAMTTAEKAQWDAGTLKGAYNISDLNRVGNCLNYLRDRLIDANYITFDVNFTAKANWNNTDIPTAADLADYLYYVSVIREAMAQFAATPQTPINTGKLNYQEANAIEKICKDVNTLINNMLAARYYCNDLYCGEI